MDNSNSKICKEVISSILEITHSNSNSQGSSKTNKQLVRHLTFFEIDKIKSKINKQIEKPNLSIRSNNITNLMK